MAQRQIGARDSSVLVGARSSFRSHQFISSVLEYIYVDGISAYKWFLSLKTGIETNKILCIDKWRPPKITESCQEAWAVALKCEMKHENKHGNIPSHPMPHPPKPSRRRY